MGTPIIRTIEGQGGNITVTTGVHSIVDGKVVGGKNIIIQVRNWQIRKTFHNADVTVTCSGGWAEYKRCLASWEFTADWPYDAASERVGVYEGVQLINNIWVPIGMDYPIAAACVFQIGAAGSSVNAGTTAIQYQGNAIISTEGCQNPAIDVVHFTISGQGTGALIGPVAGLIT